MVAQEIVKMTTFDATSDENVVKNTFRFSELIDEWVKRSNGINKGAPLTPVL